MTSAIPWNQQQRSPNQNKNDQEEEKLAAPIAGDIRMSETFMIHKPVGKTEARATGSDNESKQSHQSIENPMDAARAANIDSRGSEA